MNFINSFYIAFQNLVNEFEQPIVEESSESQNHRWKSIEDSYFFVHNDRSKPSLFISSNQIQRGKPICNKQYCTNYEGTWSSRKVILKHFEETYISRKLSKEIFQEIDKLHRLEHESIVRLYGIVENEKKANHRIVVMEHCENGTLFDYLKSQAEIPWAKKIQFAQELSQGLVYLHHHNVPCKIKSAKILLDKEHHLKWSDFGEFKCFYKVNKKNDILGKDIPWMAPELFHFETSTPSKMSEIWALGMVFFEIVSRKIPFKNVNDNKEKIEDIISGKGEKIPEECAREMPDFALLMQRCWLPLKQRPSAAEVVEEIATITDKFISAKQQQAVQYSQFPSFVETVPLLSTPEIAFGRAEWLKYFGDVEEEPPLPSCISDFLNCPCPLFPGKKIKETHILTLIPKTVNRRLLTFEVLEQLVKSAGKGKVTKFLYIWDKIAKLQKSAESHWVLMTKYLLPKSKKMSYVKQELQVRELARQTTAPYEVPKTFDAVVSVFMHYIKTGERLFNHFPLSFCRCQEQMLGPNYHIVIGCFSSAGLSVTYAANDEDEDIGVAASIPLELLEI